MLVAVQKSKVAGWFNIAATGLREGHISSLSSCGHLAYRTARWLVERIDDLKLSVQTVKRERPFRIDAIVVLPEHLHAVWSLPPDDDDYAGRWRLIKSRFSRALVKAGVGLMRNDKGEYNLWQRRYWEHTIRDAADLQRCVDYVH